MQTFLLYDDDVVVVVLPEQKYAELDGRIFILSHRKMTGGNKRKMIVGSTTTRHSLFKIVFFIFVQFNLKLQINEIMGNEQ